MLNLSYNFPYKKCLTFLILDLKIKIETQLNLIYTENIKLKIGGFFSAENTAEKGINQKMVT